MRLGRLRLFRSNVRPFIPLYQQDLTNMIDSPLLPRIAGYINGQWTDPNTPSVIPVTNPATGDQLACVPSMGAVETEAAIGAAHVLLKSETSLTQRRDWLVRIHDQLLENRDELGRIITLEQGKPLKEGVAEIQYAAGFFIECARELPALDRQRVAELVNGCEYVIHNRPAGVAALITPWNFPLAMLAKKASAAIAADCPMVAKPSELTPLTAIAFAGILERVGLDAGRFNLVMGDVDAIGRTMCSHPDVGVISFTGSTRVGSHLIAASAPHVKRLAMELGGNAPFIVFEDATIEQAADALIANKFRAGGQTCVCTNRVYVHDDVMDAFANAIVERVSRLQVGNGLEAGVDIGPLINRAAFDKVSNHVQDAMAKGATLLLGEAPTPSDESWGHFYPPTVLRGLADDALICREETFGPVIAMAGFTDEDDVIEKANATQYGLAAYVFTASNARAERVVRGLQFGHIGVNTGAGPAPQAPFGGMKMSGIGREGGTEGIFEFVELQVVANGPQA